MYDDNHYQIYTKRYWGCWAARCNRTEIWYLPFTYYAFGLSKKSTAERLERRLRKRWGGPPAHSWTEY